MISAPFARRVRPHPAALALVVAAACGDVQAISHEDAALRDAAPADGAAMASHMCAATTEFGPMMPVPGLSDPALDESTPRLSPDELTVYFTLRVPDPANPGKVLDANLYTGHRATVDDRFDMSALSQLNSSREDQDPTVSSDGLKLWFSSSSPAGTPQEGYHTYLSQRASTSADFGAPAAYATINGSDKTRDDGQDFITADSSEMWFTSTRASTVGGNDIWRAPLSNGVAGTPVIVSELNSPSNDWLPVVSADKLTVYFASNRPGSTLGPGGGFTSYDIWMSHRAAVTDKFSTPVRVTELSTTADEYPGWLSSDNCRLYLSSIDSAGQHLDVFMATRLP